MEMKLQTYDTTVTLQISHEITKVRWELVI